MNVNESIKVRRAYRSLTPCIIQKSIITALSRAAQLAPSCFNNQPWRYVFVTMRQKLQQLHKALLSGNEWAQNASMIIAVCSKKEYDCVIKNQEYYLFDTGISTGFLILQATNLGLVAHPIAGFKPHVVRTILNIPDDLSIISLVIVGAHSDHLNPLLSDTQKEAEKTRPPRLPLDKIVSKNSFAFIDDYDKEG